MKWACIALALVACRGSEHKAPAPAPATGSGSQAGSGSAAAAGSAGSAAAGTPEMKAFCVRSMQQIQRCFEDDAFWDAHATAYFAALKQPIEPDAKKQWIGVYKDSFVSLVRNHELEQNCDTMLQNGQLPTQQQMQLVDQASKQSCAAFGGALGYVLYSEGAFYKPRDGAMVPDTLDPGKP